MNQSTRRDRIAEAASARDQIATDRRCERYEMCRLSSTPGHACDCMRSAISRVRRAEAEHEMMSEETTPMRRILARVENPDGAFPELDWINSRTGILGESFGMASRSIQDLIDDGSMIVVRTEAIDNG